jgi:tripartite-type tricarboxylate transporter receptor subunit TctC
LSRSSGAGDDQGRRKQNTAQPYREDDAMKHWIRLVVAAGLAFASAATQGQTTAPQPYPSRPITIIVPFGPGSATDTITRVVAQHLSVALNQTVVVENKAGANGVIAANYAAHAAPDGYTLFMSTNSPHSAAPHLMKNVPYDPVKDFTAITRMGSYTLMLVIHPSIPAHSVKELIAHARANPGKLSYASGNTSGIVAGATLKHWAKLDIVHVPYKSSPPAVQDLLAGRVAMMFNDFTASMPHVRANTMRALAVSRIKRSTLYPELPTMDEAGVTGFDMDSWAAIFAPAKTPSDIVTRLNTELRRIIDSPEVQTKLRNVGFEAFSSSPQELDTFVKFQLEKWAKMVKDAGIQPQ